MCDHVNLVLVCLICWVCIVFVLWFSDTFSCGMCCLVSCTMCKSQEHSPPVNDKYEVLKCFYVILLCSGFVRALLSTQTMPWRNRKFTSSEETWPWDRGTIRLVFGQSSISNLRPLQFSCITQTIWKVSGQSIWGFEFILKHSELIYCKTVVMNQYWSIYVMLLFLTTM